VVDPITKIEMILSEEDQEVEEEAAGEVAEEALEADHHQEEVTTRLDQLEAKDRKVVTIERAAKEEDVEDVDDKFDKVPLQTY
jgi:hypothetical protein